MPRYFSLLVTVLVMGLLVVGCNMAGPRGQMGDSSSDKPQADDPPAVASSAGQASPGESDPDKEKEHAKKLEKLNDELDELERQRDKLERDLAVAAQRLEVARLEMAQAEFDAKTSVDHAEQELALAQRRLAVHREQYVPTRLARDELDLKWARDSVTENREELQQLELMYNEDEFADKTKEIVLERARRRLANVERNLEIREKESATLREETIPIETREQEVSVTERERGHERARRSAEQSLLNHRIGVMNAENEIARLHSDQELKNKELDKKRKEIAECEAEK